MQKNKNQLLRLIFIDKKIRDGMQSGSLANCRTIAEEYEISPKSILRDIDFLKYQWGAPIIYDRSRHGYRYAETNYRMPAINLTESDLFAICLAQQALQQLKIIPSYKKLVSFFNKIEEHMPRTITMGNPISTPNISLLAGPQAIINPDVWQEVAYGLQKKRRLNIAYRKTDAHGADDVRRVDPYHLFNHSGGWYLVGFCHRRKDIRTFAVSRIETVQVTDTTLTMPI